MMYGSQTPYWDDWMMGTRMAMYMESGLDTTWLYGLANGHRATFSKITNLLLFKFNNNQWDPYLTMVFDTFIWGIIGALMLYIGFRARSRINFWLFASVVIILWVYPLSLFNILSTVQTYLYYMILSAVWGFWLVTNKAFSLKWCCGVLLIAAACMTTGGGSFAPVAVTAVSCFLAIFNKQSRTQHLITAAIVSILSVFGLYLILSQGGSSVVGSRSLTDLLTSLLKALSWPASDRAWPSIIFLLPIGLLAFGLARQKIEQSRIATFALMMAGFGIMLSIAIAYARGTNGNGPSGRYFDFFTIYLVSSTLALMLIQGGDLKFQRIFNRSLAVLWIVMCMLAVPYHLHVFKFLLNDRALLVPVQDDIMARYSVASDPEILENRSFRQVPYHSKKNLRYMMNLLNETDTLPYNLQSSNMELQIEDNAFVLDGIAQPRASRYRGLEPVLGSFNLDSGAGLNAMGQYTSELFVAKRPYIMIPVSGYLGLTGTSLKLVGENNGREVSVVPTALPDSDASQWQDVLVRAPDKKYRIVAEDKSTALWFAYAAPRSVGRLSYFTDRVIKSGDKIWVFGLLLLVVAFRRQIIQWVSLKMSQIQNGVRT